MKNLFIIHWVSDIRKNKDRSPNPLNQAWLKKNWIVLGWIQSLVAPPMFSLVMGYSIAYE